MRLGPKLAAAACCATALLGLSATSASAASGLPAGTVITGNLKSGTKLKFVGTIDGVSITVTCTTFTAKGKIPKSGMVVTLSAAPTIKGCTDSLGGSDTVKTNSTNGKWTLRETIASTGDKAILGVPKAGATFVSSVLTTCTVTAAPNGRAKVTGKYNGTNTIKDTGAPIPTSGTGCTTSANAKETATIVLKPAPGNL